MSIKVVDTTLRDGEQKAGIALGINEKVEIAKILDDMGIFQIEAGIAAMGGDEKESIKKIVKLGLKSKISSWNRMNIKDINESMDCAVDIIHISVPVSNIQIEEKLRKDKNWVLENIKECVQYAVGKGYEVTVGLEDASRADINFLIEVCKLLYNSGIKRIRYADTVGILYPRRVFHQINKIREAVPIEIEIHAHNDFGMAIINSLGALKAGAKYVDCTITGIGERAGNCDFLEFAKTAYELLGEKIYLNKFSELKKKESIIKEIIG
ncbi:beta/alpha barrel domain-containing protein [Clostridium guangxiense]|uniref:homocitrate synthase n=1 Tax=Clostridium guangxiense TaxID=1662055 RepID=UPI001E44A448|nr:homocitrate synthase [Clostridium guangxiense]MCD2348934.1 homocitrate synthase [Clostridium guangxiense]